MLVDPAATYIGLGARLCSNDDRLYDAQNVERTSEGECHAGILSWVIVGLIAGFIGSKIVNRTGEGLVRDILLGILGAVVAGAIFTELGLVGVTA